MFKNVKFLLEASGVFPTAKGFKNQKIDKLIRVIKICWFITILFGFYSLTFIYSIKYLRMMEAVKAAGYINNGVLCVGIGYTLLVHNRNVLLNSIGGWERAISKSIYIKIVKLSEVGANSCPGECRAFRFTCWTSKLKIIVSPNPKWPNDTLSDFSFLPKSKIPTKNDQLKISYQKKLFFRHILRINGFRLK